MGWAMGAPSEDHTTPPSSRFFLLEEAPCVSDWRVWIFYKSPLLPPLTYYNEFGSSPRQNCA